MASILSVVFLLSTFLIEDKPSFSLPDSSATSLVSNQTITLTTSSNQMTISPDEFKKQAQYQRIEAAILLVTGIACLGLTLIGLIMLYSIAIRRQVKRDKAEESRMMSGSSLVYLTNNPLHLPEMPVKETDQ